MSKYIYRDMELDAHREFGKDVFRDLELEAANELIANAKIRQTTGINIPPVSMEIPKGVLHDENGNPSFENRPSSAQLVAEINRTQGAQLEAAKAENERKAERRRNKGLAYQRAALCLMETHHELTSAQMVEMNKLAKQIHQTGKMLIKT